MLKLTKDEIAFLRWLWTNGGQARLSGKIKPGSTDRMTSAGYIVADVDVDRPVLCVMPLPSTDAKH